MEENKTAEASSGSPLSPIQPYRADPTSPPIASATPATELASHLPSKSAKSTSPPPPSNGTKATSSSAGSLSYADSIRFIEQLGSEGLTTQQAEAVLDALNDFMHKNLRATTRDVVLRSEQDKMVYMYKVDFAQLKSELQMLSKNEFALLKGETERLTDEIEKLKQKMRDDVARVQAGFRLDLNLEKGRIRDEASGTQLKIKETDAKMETEFSTMRTLMEAIKYDTLKTIIGTLSTLGLLVLGYMRFLRS